MYLNEYICHGRPSMADEKEKKGITVEKLDSPEISIPDNFLRISDSSILLAGSGSSGGTDASGSTGSGGSMAGCKGGGGGGASGGTGCESIVDPDQKNKS